MNSISDPKNVVGLAGLLKDDDIESNIDLGDLEREIAKGAAITEDEEQNIADAFKNDMERLSRNFNVNMAMEGNHESLSPIISPVASPAPSHRSYKSHQSHETSVYDFNTSKTSYPNNNVSNHSDFHHNSQYDDPQMNYMTREESDQNKINNVLKTMGDQEPEFNVNKEKEEDDKCSLLEQIDMLRMTLEDDGVEISNVPVVNKSNSVREIRDVYKSLRLKNDRNRYRSFAEEVILAGAHGLEILFDGKKEYFGRKIDLVGWPDTVKVKLRRMRFETSSLVQDIMQEHNVSSGSRLALELFPSMFLYSRNRRLTKDDNLVSDKQYKSAIDTMNSF